MYNSFYGNNPARLNTNPISQGEHSIEPRSNSGVLCTIQTRELRKVQKRIIMVGKGARLLSHVAIWQLE